MPLPGQQPLLLPPPPPLVRSLPAGRPSCPSAPLNPPLPRPAPPAGGLRADAATWPGGGVAQYCRRVFDEVLPWAQAAYGAGQDPASVAFGARREPGPERAVGPAPGAGQLRACWAPLLSCTPAMPAWEPLPAPPSPARAGGSSFGGICTLWACMHHGDRFGAALVESPSLWFADERFLRRAAFFAFLPSLLGVHMHWSVGMDAAVFHLAPVLQPSPRLATPIPLPPSAAAQGGPAAVRRPLAAPPVCGHGHRRIQRHARRRSSCAGQCSL